MKDSSSAVSCLMPTYNRREFIQRSLRCFANQDYPTLNLLILDDGTDPIQDLLPEDSRIKYIRRTGAKQNHGQKMNVLCAMAETEYVIVWDDDDIYSKDRVTRQIAPLIAEPSIQVTGSSQLHYFKEKEKQGYLYTSKPVTWIGAIAFRKSLWQRHKFDETGPAGADTRWLNKAVSRAEWHDLKDPAIACCAVHGSNDSRKNVAIFKPVDWSAIEEQIDASLGQTHK